MISYLRTAKPGEPVARMSGPWFDKTKQRPLTKVVRSGMVQFIFKKDEPYSEDMVNQYHEFKASMPEKFRKSIVNRFAKPRKCDHLVACFTGEPGYFVFPLNLPSSYYQILKYDDKPFDVKDYIHG